MDGYAEAITTAIENLVCLDADYADVDAALIAAGSLVPANYQNWSAVADAIDAIVYGLNITQQSAVDGYAQAIATARVAGKTDADIRALVKTLHAKRAEPFEGVTQ